MVTACITCTRISTNNSSIPIWKRYFYEVVHATTEVEYNDILRLTLLSSQLWFPWFCRSESIAYTNIKLILHSSLTPYDWSIFILELNKYLLSQWLYDCLHAFISTTFAPIVAHNASRYPSSNVIIAMVSSPLSQGKYLSASNWSLFIA